MPKKITAYTCEFKCKRKVLVSKKAMQAHELKCFRNPARKACVTCKYFESYIDSNGMESEPLLLDQWRHTEFHKEHDISEKLIFDCEDHKPKEQA